MKRTLLLMPLIAALFLGACATGVLENGEDRKLRPLVESVVKRHDAYVAADAALTPAQKTAATAESATALGLFDAEQVPAHPAGQVLVPVLDRHDAYVQADATLPASVKSVALFSSSNIRRTLSAAGP